MFNECNTKKEVMMDGFIHKSKKHVGFIIKFGGIYSSIASFLSDFFKPLLNTTIFCAILALLFFLVVSLLWSLQFVFPKFKEYNDIIIKKTDGYWFSSIFISSIICLSIFSLMSYFNYNKPDGYFAAKSTMVNNLQKDIGLINETLTSIKENTKVIAEKSKNIDKNTEIIRDETASIKTEVSRINEKSNNFKKEISDDPRKELANMGISWNKYNFENCLGMSDEKCIRLFLLGGFSLNITSDYNPAPITLKFFMQSNPDKNIMNTLLSNGLKMNDPIYKLSEFLAPDNMISLYQNEIFDRFFTNIAHDKFSLADIIGFFSDETDDETLIFLSNNGADFGRILKVLNDIKYDAKHHCRELYYSKDNTKKTYKLPEKRWKLEDEEGLYTEDELEHLQRSHIMANEVLYGEICTDTAYNTYKLLETKINKIRNISNRYNSIYRESEIINKSKKYNLVRGRGDKYMKVDPNIND